MKLANDHTTPNHEKYVKGRVKTEMGFALFGGMIYYTDEHGDASEGCGDDSSRCNWDWNQDLGKAECNPYPRCPVGVKLDLNVRTATKG